MFWFKSRMEDQVIKTWIEAVRRSTGLKVYDGDKKILTWNIIINKIYWPRR